MKTLRMTTAQALIRYLAAQHVERDGVRQRFFGGVAGIFGPPEPVLAEDSVFCSGMRP